MYIIQYDGFNSQSDKTTISIFMFGYLLIHIYIYIMLQRCKFTLAIELRCGSRQFPVNIVNGLFVGSIIPIYTCMDQVNDDNTRSENESTEVLQNRIRADLF